MKIKNKLTHNLRPVFGTKKLIQKTGLVKENNKAFTLVELIVVITILAVLSTIGFVSYSGYLSGVRDTNRISQLKSISDGLSLFSTNHSLPTPDDKIDLKANSEIIGYQGYAGKNVLETITYSTAGVDPKDKTYYSYYLTRDKKYYQLMAFLEEEDNLQISSVFNKTSAVDYSIRYPTVIGTKLGILTDENNTPVQEVAEIQAAGKIDLGGTNSGTVYSAHINDGRTYTFTGRVLNNKLYTISKPGKYGPPKDCPDGFIGVWGDSAFNQLGFCVAKYEMTYEDADTAVSSDGYSTNTVPYEVGKKIISMAGKYPIVSIKTSEAIDACKSIGKGYHLVMDSEYMSIARQVELEKENWSSGEILNGFIYNGVSKDTIRGCDSKGGNSGETYTFGTKTGPGNNSCDSKRQLILFNYQKIWDFAGNVSEYVNKNNTLDGSGYNSGTTTINGIDNSDSDSDGIYDITDMEKYGSIFYLGISNGMGTVKENYSTPSNIFNRGFSAYDGDQTGIFALDTGSANNDNVNSFRGFRCAYIK